MISNIPPLHQRRMAGHWVGNLAYDVYRFAGSLFCFNHHDEIRPAQGKLLELDFIKIRSMK